MFSLFGKKPKKASSLDILELDDSLFVAAVKAGLESSPPAAWTMCVVAYQNLEPILMARRFQASLAKAQVGTPNGIDSLIVDLHRDIENASDELERRRKTWFFQALLIRRATEMASSNPALIPDVEEIWILLARGSMMLAEALENNVLWSGDEKRYFDVVRDEIGGIKYCLNIMMPKFLRGSKRIASFADEHDVWLSVW